jgi:hypothetical protein
MMPAAGAFASGPVTRWISPAEAFEYYQVRQSERIYLLSLYLHPLTIYSVRSRTFHFPVTPSKRILNRGLRRLRKGFAYRYRSFFSPSPRIAVGEDQLAQ